MSSDTSAVARQRVLLQFAGNQRNDPSLGDERPAMRVAALPAIAPLSQAFVLHTAGDAVATQHGEALARDLGKGRRGAVKVSLRAVSAGEPADATERASVHAPVEALVDALAQREFGSRFGEVEFIVSAVTGTAAQWTSLVDALDARGAHLTVVWERADESLSVWRAPPETRVSEPQLTMLERAPAAWNVLLTGPTGTGKTSTARRLHAAWERSLGRRGMFVHVNAGAFSRELLQSELFGHAKGAYTGAQTAREGAFRRANGGTLFLDEIGDLPLDLQVQLLTALDVEGRSHHRTVTPLGGDKPERVDARVVFGTNRDLHAMANDNRFRLDLLGRISTHHVRLPALASTRHRIAGAYVHHLEALAPLYALEGSASVRFGFDAVARRRLHEFIFSPTSAWPWNHRDVQQSAERLATRAWAASEGGGSRRKGADKLRRLTIAAAHVDAELDELRTRWRALAADTGDDRDTGWEAVQARVRPDAWARLSMVERWELRYLLEAREAAGNNADAWRRIGAQNLLEGASDPASQRNPSNAFNKRWQRYAAKMLP